jgi:hypothetical protein
LIEGYPTLPVLIGKGFFFITQLTESSLVLTFLGFFIWPQTKRQFLLNKPTNYRIMAVVKVKTDIITNIAVSTIRQVVILYVKTIKTDIIVFTSNVICLMWLVTDNFQYQSVLWYRQYHSEIKGKLCNYLIMSMANMVFTLYYHKCLLRIRKKRQLLELTTGTV